MTLTYVKEKQKCQIGLPNFFLSDLCCSQMLPETFPGSLFLIFVLRHGPLRVEIVSTFQDCVSSFLELLKEQCNSILVN